MQTIRLQQEQHRECILFFNGWGMDPAPFHALPATGCDLCMFIDYRTLEPVDLQMFAGYDRLHLVAWSMGVWVAAHLLADRADCFATSTAMGGTLSPIDNQRGIPAASYNAMLDQFTAQTLDSFYENMFDSREQLHTFLENRPKREVAELRDELQAFSDAFFNFGPAPDIYQRKIITSRDRIYSARNQLRAWGKNSAEVRNWPHFPFYMLTDWHELLLTQ
ncbi:MAG: alpha/beta fold hydrolase [Desulfobulbus sp.]|nr:alpha/beta fold hydrolase [Desulfobulbus sp.]